MTELTIGELLALREEMGAKQFEEEISGPKIRALKRKQDPNFQPRKKNDPSDTVKPAKLVKHAPEEISSKKRPPKMRQVVPEAKEKVTDPRFREDVTSFNQTAFDKRFAFVADMEKREKVQLEKKLKKVKNKELKGDIFKLINRIDQKAASRKERAEIRERETELKREERRKQADGKGAYFVKKGLVGKEYRAEKAKEKQEARNSTQTAKFEAKKERKNAQKEKKFLPQRRNQQ